MKKFLIILLGNLIAFNAFAFSVLTTEESADLQFMIQEEKLAYDTYNKLAEKWDVQVFKNIPQKSEIKHIQAIADLLNFYSVTNPIVGLVPGEFINQDLQTLYVDLIAKGQSSLTDALNVGGFIEEVDMRDLNNTISRTDKSDIKVAYENLLCGSRNHLRAFARMYKNTTGSAYLAQVLTKDELEKILAVPHEQCLL